MQLQALLLLWLTELPVCELLQVQLLPLALPQLLAQLGVVVGLCDVMSSGCGSGNDEGRIDGGERD